MPKSDENKVTAADLQSKTTPHPNTEEITELTEQIARLNEEKDILTNQLLETRQRSQAEIANIQKRQTEELTKARKFGTQSLLQNMLPILDSLEKGIETCSDESIKAGLAMTLDLALETLKKEGLEIVNPLNQIFDPNFHEAISTESQADAKTNEVIKVLQTGYKLKDRSLRAALVIINK